MSYGRRELGCAGPVAREDWGHPPTPTYRHGHGEAAARYHAVGLLLSCHPLLHDLPPDEVLDDLAGPHQVGGAGNIVLGDVQPKLRRLAHAKAQHPR